MRDLSVGVLYPWTGLPAMDRGAARRVMPLITLLAENFKQVTVLSPDAGPFTAGGASFIPVRQSPLEKVWMEWACKLYEGLTYHGLNRLDIRSRRQWWHFIRPLLHGSLRRELARLSNQADILLLEYPFWSESLRHAMRANPKPVILTMHDLLSGICKNPWLEKRVHASELAAARRADAVVCVTEEEARLVRDEGVAAVHIPHGFVLEEPGAAASSSPDDSLVARLAARVREGATACLFLGSSLIPNREAVEGILEMAAACPPEGPLLFVTAGACCGHGQPLPNVISLGPVSEKDLHLLYGLCGVVLAPLRSGTGASTKVIEALAKGRVLVSTRVGIRGYEGIRDGVEAVLCDDLALWPSILTRLAQDSPQRARLAAGGTAYAGKFDFRKVYQPYLDLISRLRPNS